MFFCIWNDKKRVFGTRILFDKKRRLGDGPFWRGPLPFFPDSRPTKLTLETLPPPVAARLVGWGNVQRPEADWEVRVQVRGDLHTFNVDSRPFCRVRSDLLVAARLAKIQAVTFSL